MGEEQRKSKMSQEKYAYLTQPRRNFPPTVTFLDVSNNKINKIEDLGMFREELKHLSTLFVHNNRLTHIPVEFVMWSTLRTFEFCGNPFVDLPLDAQKTWYAMRRFLINRFDLAANVYLDPTAQNDVGGDRGVASTGLSGSSYRMGLEERASSTGALPGLRQAR